MPYFTCRVASDSPPTFLCTDAISQKPGCKCKSGCQGKRCACHQNGASCKTDQCGCKATCSNPINAFSFIFGPGNEPEEVHPCFLTWILGKQQEQQKEIKKKKKKVSLREIWEREEPRIWDECMRADYDALWSSSDDMKQNARDFKSLPEDKQDSFVSSSHILPFFATRS